MEPAEANIADRMGLRAAAGSYLAEVGRLIRDTLAGPAGWQVTDPPDAPAAITALRPAAGQDVPPICVRLLAGYYVLTTACLPERATRDSLQGSAVSSTARPASWPSTSGHWAAMS